MCPSISEFITIGKTANSLANTVWNVCKGMRGIFSPSKYSASRIPRCSGYFRREEDEKIREKLKILCKGKDSAIVKTLLLHGPPGYGKLYTAANLMHTLHTLPISNSFLSRTDQGIRKFFLTKVPIKWTLDVTNTRTLFESYRSLAKEIGLTEEAKAANWEISLHNRTPEGRQYQMYLHDHYQKDPYDEALKQIYEEVMKALRQQDSWVLLIEGPTEKVAALRRFWPEPGDRGSGNGLVIITTRYPSTLPFEDGDNSTLQKVYVGEMKHHDAVNFLQIKTGMAATGSDKMYAEDIAVKMLECNPERIAMFGAFVRERNDERNKTLSYKDLPRMETVTPFESDACMLTLEMDRRNQETLLKSLACCSGENYLPLQCLQSCFTEAAETVNHSNFVDVLERDGVQVVKIHPRHHETLRNMLTSSRKPTPSGFLRRWSLFRNKTNSIVPPVLSAHDVLQIIKCLSSNCKDALQRSRDEDFIMLRFILPHLKEAVELFKNLIPESDREENQLVMANGHACLGEMLLFFGESEEAIENLEIALRSFKDYNGPENVLLDEANVLHFLGEAYGNSSLGNPSKGALYLKEALKEKERYYEGKDDPQVAFTLRSLANVLNELGKHHDAIASSKRAVDIYYENGYPFKQEYGYSLSTLGSSYRYLGQYVQAEKYLLEALKIFRSVDSPSKLRMGVTLSRLASVQRNLEKLDESIKSLKEAKEMYGNNDIYKAVILSKLSVTYRYKEDPENSLLYAEKAAEITDKHHGMKDHPVIATALLNLGHAQSDAGSVEDAERNLTRALNIYKELHGENHRLIALTLNYLGYAYLQMGQVGKAKETLERAVKIMDNFSPPEHPEKANSFKRLSKACLILGETIKSAELANRALKIYQVVLATYGNMMEHREVRKCTLRVAQACSKLGLFTEAEEYIREIELGFPEKTTAYPEFAVFLRTKAEIALDNLEFNCPGEEKSMRKLMSNAEDDLNRADKIIQQALGRNHQQYAFLEKEKARLCLLTGDYDKAFKKINCALSIITNSIYQKRDVHADLLLIKADIQGKLKLSKRGQKESLQKAEKLYRDALGDNHPMLAFTLQKMYKKNIELLCLKQAKEYLETSDKICKILKTSLRLQLDGSSSDFLANYNLDQHPILKRQQQLRREIQQKQRFLDL